MVPNKEDIVGWHRKLNAKGWAVPHWPVEWGGQNWTTTQRFILREELEMAPAPLPNGMNVSLCGPVVAHFGTEEQKKRFLPRMANCDDWWCQGFSEPGSGSDLASLKTSARREGDHYIVNGSKMWTTNAQYADWIFCLVRTDPKAKKQEGISFLLFDMKSPGVSVRPVHTMEGGAEVNQCFFEDVKVPVDQLIGVENKGWDCAKFLLGNERTGAARIGAMRERIAAPAQARHGGDQERQADHRGSVVPQSSARRSRSRPRRMRSPPCASSTASPGRRAAMRQIPSPRC